MFKYRFYIIIMAFLSLSISCTHTKSIVNKDGLMLGKVSKKDFNKPPVDSWFNTEYSSYSPDKNSLDMINNDIKNKEILIYFGSWCSDSRREVPRFIKILDYLNMKYKNVHFTALNRMKKAPNYKNNIWNIQYVPTFIILDNGKEIGRIIESPEETLELDLIKIIK